MSLLQVFAERKFSLNHQVCYIDRVSFSMEKIEDRCKANTFPARGVTFSQDTQVFRAINKRYYVNLFFIKP